jgi:hypothetical protein
LSPALSVGAVCAVVVLEGGEGEVDAGGHARRRPPIAVVHVEAIGDHVHRRVPAGQAIARPPVGGGLVPVEQPGGSQQERSAADRGDPLGPAR